MPLLRVEAEKLSNNQLEQGVIEEIIDRDDTFAFLPFKGIKGKAYVYERENTLSEGTFLDPNDEVVEGAATFTEVTTKLRIIAGDVDVDKFLEETMDDTNDQKATQIAAKAKGVGRKFKAALINGNNAVNAKEFDGMNKLVTTTGNLIHADGGAGAAGGAISLDLIDELLDAVTNGADALVMRKGTLRALKALWRAAGGNTGNMLQVNNFGMVVPAHDGVPILINDFIAGNVTEGSSTSNTCSIYAVRFNEADGLHGLYGGKTAGIRVEDVGTVQNKDASRTRVKFYAGLALKSTKSLAACRGITNV